MRSDGSGTPVRVGAGARRFGWAFGQARSAGRSGDGAVRRDHDSAGDASGPGTAVTREPRDRQRPSRAPTAHTAAVTAKISEYSVRSAVFRASVYVSTCRWYSAAETPNGSGVARLAVSSLKR